MMSASMLSPGLLKSGLRRYWPLWLAGLAALLLAFDLPVYTTVSQLALSSGSMADHVTMLENTWDIMRLEGWFYAFVWAIVVALALNDHLFDARSATFVGSLPVKRGAVFNSVLVGGLVVLVGLPLLAALALLPLRLIVGPLFSLGGVATWFAVTTAVAVVFYAFALLFCQLSGTRSVALLLYLVLSWLAVCLEGAMRMIVPTLMYGMPAGEVMFGRLSPALWMARAATGWMNVNDGVPEWGSIVAYLLVALGVMFGARALYERRDLEAAGDSIAYVQVRPFLKYLAGISMSLLFGFIYRLLGFFNVADELPMRGGEVIVMALMLVAGASLGVLFAEMIMSRSARVLAKVWRGALVLSCAAVVFVGVCHYDVFGAVRHVPDPTEVERVALNCEFYTDGMTITSPEGVTATCDLHRDLIEYGGAGDRNLPCFMVNMTYELKDGRRMVRSYPVLSDYFEYRGGGYAADQGSLLLDRLAEIANSEEGRASRFASILEADYTKLKVQIEYAQSTGANTSIELLPDERKDFVENALRPDLMEEMAGDVFVNIAINTDTAYDATLSVLEPLDEYGNGYKSLFNMWIGEDNTPNTVSWLREHHPEIELRAWSLEPKI